MAAYNHKSLYLLGRKLEVKQSLILEEKKQLKNKNEFAMTLLVIFALSIVTSIPLTSIPIANAQETPTMKTYPIVDAIPNPVGVGQETLLKCGISEAAPSASYGWSGITITVRKP